jgi:hypothetical protein
MLLLFVFRRVWLLGLVLRKDFLFNPKPNLFVCVNIKVIVTIFPHPGLFPRNARIVMLEEEKEKKN